MRSDDGKYVVCGSEDRRVYIWKTLAQFYHQENTDDSVTDTETSSVKTDATEPMTKKQLKEIAKRQKQIAKQEKKAEKARKKEEKSLTKKLAKNEPESFEAHKDTVISAVLAPMKTRQLLAVDGVVMITADETGCIRIWTCTSITEGDQSSSSEKSSWWKTPHLRNYTMLKNTADIVITCTFNSKYTYTYIYSLCETYEVFWIFGLLKIFFIYFLSNKVNEDEQSCGWCDEIG